MTFPQDILQVTGCFSRAGYEIYAVGGCVRDALRGKDPHDYDFCTDALPDDMKCILTGFHLIETGIRHGTLTVLTGEGRPLEITTYRVDGNYTDHRRPDSVCFTRSLFEDCARRDFTINAMAYNPVEGLRDFFGGQRDLSGGIIRCVGDPDRRFQEDALRILRGLRFASVLSFSVEEDTACAMERKRHLLGSVSRERVTAEFRRLLTGKDASSVLSDYAGVLSEVLPFADKCSTGLLKNSFSHLSSEEARCAAYLWLCGITSPDDAGNILRKMTFEGVFCTSVCFLLSVMKNPLPVNDGELRRAVGASSPEQWLEALCLRGSLVPEEGLICQSLSARVLELKESGTVCRISQLAINGYALQSYGFRGKEIGNMLSCILSAVTDGRVENTQEALLNYVESFQMNKYKN